MSLENNKSVTISISGNLNNNNKINSNKNDFGKLNRDMFKFNYIIGKGGFGKVWQVVYRKTKEKYALKEMSKAKIIDKNNQKFINNELTLLKKLRNDFIVNINYAFQDRDNLYLVIDFLSGGDLRYHISRYHNFSEEQTRFFISCIIQGLSHIHNHNIIHRDLKPENLVLDSRGYARITDFGVAKENEKDNSLETSGTPGYMSPEVLFKKNHTFSADFFAIGVICYEFMKGKRPFLGTREEIKQQMNDRKYLEEKVKIKEDDNFYKKGWSCESFDFINSLLELNPNKRLGSKYGINELKEHEWLKYYLWEEIENKKLEAPFIPDIDRDNFDKDYCTNNEVITEKTKKRYKKIIESSEYQNAFINFYFNKDIIINNKRPFNKIKIVIDGNLDNKFLKTSKSNKIVLNIRKFGFNSNNGNIHEKTKNNELIKEIIEDDSNIYSKNNKKNLFLDNNLNKNNNLMNKDNNNDDEIFIKKLKIKNSGRKINIKDNNKYNNYSLSPKISINNLFLKYNNSSNSNKNQNIIKQYSFLNININTIKNKNIFTNSNNPFIKSNNSPMNKNSRSKNNIISSNVKMKKVKSVFIPYLGLHKHNKGSIRDIFFKKIYNPIDKDKDRRNYSNKNKENHINFKYEL